MLMHKFRGALCHVTLSLGGKHIFTSKHSNKMDHLCFPLPDVPVSEFFFSSKGHCFNYNFLTCVNKRVLFNYKFINEYKYPFSQNEMTFVNYIFFTKLSGTSYLRKVLEAFTKLYVCTPPLPNSFRSCQEYDYHRPLFQHHHQRNIQVTL